MQWRRMDLHVHTPASSDYQEEKVTYLDILQTAEARGVDIIAFTDHNTVAGYRMMLEEISDLELLEKLNRYVKELGVEEAKIEHEDTRIKWSVEERDQSEITLWHLGDKKSYHYVFAIKLPRKSLPTLPKK